MSETPAKYEYAITPEVAEALVVEGDLSKLTPAQRTEYYVRVCKSLSLNPLTRPFQYIKLQNKLTLYATRDATDQIRNIRNISIRLVRREFILDNALFLVEVEAELPNGRKDFASAVVPVAGLSGDALANAMMKAETKAKRRVTLSIAGLGMLDETEVETIPDAQPANGEAVYPSEADVRGEGTNGDDAHEEKATEKQVKAIQILAKRAGMSKDEYKQTLMTAYNVDSSRKLTKEQASEFIEYLQSLAEERQSEAEQSGDEQSEDDAPIENPIEFTKQRLAELGFSQPESISIRSAISESQVDPQAAAQVLKAAQSREDAVRGLLTLGVRNVFKRSGAVAASIS